MGFRLRKSIKVAPGVRLNVSKRGVGVSAGVGGVRRSYHSSGRQTTTVRSGVPGVYYQSTRGSGSSAKGSKGSKGRAAAAPPASAGAAKPGLFAPSGEKALFKAWSKQDGELAAQVGEQHGNMALPAFTIAGLLIANTDGDRALGFLKRAFAEGDASETAFFKKYVHASADLTIIDGVHAVVPLGRNAVGLSIAELHRSDNEIEQAVDVVEQLDPTTFSAVMLADLYAQLGRYDEVVELTEGVTNEDDASALLLVYRGVALREQGFRDAAHEAFKEALRSRSREATIRHHALFERAQNYQQQGKKAMARKDLERILAEDSTYPGVREQLVELAP